jgi:hypothetical protein
MWGRLQKLLDRLEARIALWQIIRGSGVLGTGAVTGWLSSSVAWVNQFGAFGWWMAFLCGCVLAAATLSLFALVKLRLVQASATNHWQTRVDTVNPLDKEFTRRRMSFLELANPMNGRIKDKRFLDCEFFGRYNVIGVGCAFSNVSFIDCDFVIAKEHSYTKNIYIMEQCHFIGGSIYNATLYVSQDEWDNHFSKMGANLVSYPKAGDPSVQ